MSPTTRGIVRVTNHPRKDEWLVLKFGPDLNSLIGTFGPAQQALDLGGYVMHRDNLGALQQWARHNAVQLMVEVRAYGEPTKPVQCGNTIGEPPVEETCCAPYPASRIPKFCGACGQPAMPVTFSAAEAELGVKCPACDRVNQGGGRFCVSCSTALPDRHLRAPVIRRSKGEPKPLGEAIAELDLPTPTPRATRAGQHTSEGDEVA